MAVASGAGRRARGDGGLPAVHPEAAETRPIPYSLNLRAFEVRSGDPPRLGQSSLCGSPCAFTGVAPLAAPAVRDSAPARRPAPDSRGKDLRGENPRFEKFKRAPLFTTLS